VAVAGCSHSEYVCTLIENGTTAMTKQAIELMFGLYRRTILAFLFSRPGEDFHVRELARELQIPVGSLQRELKALTSAGLLRRQRVGNQVRYRVDTTHPLYQDLASIFNKTLGVAGVIRDALAELQQSIDFAFVFGSVAKGQEASHSDIDLMVLGHVSFEQAVNAIWPAQERLNREINAVVMTAAEFASKARDGDGFEHRVASQAKLFVIGSSDDFEKLVGNRAIA
jgi:predicted nucleotidyltransferase/DNA-binding HxlR family transcriptional regulator